MIQKGRRSSSRTSLLLYEIGLSGILTPFSSRSESVWSPRLPPFFASPSVDSSVEGAVLKTFQRWGHNPASAISSSSTKHRERPKTTSHQVSSSRREEVCRGRRRGGNRPMCPMRGRTASPLALAYSPGFGTGPGSDHDHTVWSETLWGSIGLNLIQ